MSQKEAPRVGLLKALGAGRVTGREVAAAVRRCFEAAGAEGLLHRGRGRSSPRRLVPRLRQQVVRLLTTTYRDFDDAGSPRARRPMPSCPPSGPTTTGASRGPPARPQPAWRRPPRELAVLLGCRYRRRVAADNTAIIEEEGSIGRLAVLTHGSPEAVQDGPQPRGVVRNVPGIGGTRPEASRAAAGNGPGRGPRRPRLLPHNHARTTPARTSRTAARARQKPTMTAWASWSGSTSGLCVAGVMSPVYTPPWCVSRRIRLRGITESPR
jgi:hypothetical protein